MSGAARARLAHQLRIHTPEGITFAYELASPVARALAWTVDFLCILALIRIGSFLLAIASLISEDVGQGLGFILAFLAMVGYAIALESHWNGQTIGKRLLRLRVIDGQGLRLRPSQVVVRNLMRVVDGLPMCYLVGGIACLLSRDGQRLGDLAAGTVVVRIPKLSEPDLSQVPEGKFNSLASWPHLAARLRQAVSPEEAALALRALLGRERLELDARLTLYRELADHFRAKVAFPPEASDGLSDEQYLRNVLGVVFRGVGPRVKHR